MLTEQMALYVPSGDDSMIDYYQWDVQVILVLMKLFHRTQASYMLILLKVTGVMLYFFLNCAEK